MDQKEQTDVAVWKYERTVQSKQLDKEVSDSVDGKMWIGSKY